MRITCSVYNEMADLGLIGRTVLEARQPSDGRNLDGRRADARRLKPRLSVSQGVGVWCVCCAPCDGVRKRKSGWGILPTVLYGTHKRTVELDTKKPENNTNADVRVQAQPDTRLSLARLIARGCEGAELVVCADRDHLPARVVHPVPRDLPLGSSSALPARPRPP